MAEDFKYDVFLSHSAKDKTVVRPVAERLRTNGLRVWFDEWEIRPGDSIPAKIEEGLEYSRVLVLCMSANAFGSDWAQLEAGTFRFRDPLNKERRFIPLRLDDAPIKGSLSQLLYINWLPADREQEYAKLLEACRPPVRAKVWQKKSICREFAGKVVQLKHKNIGICAYAFTPDGKRVITGCSDESMRLWDLETCQLKYVFKGDTHNPFKEGTYPILKVQWSYDGQRALSYSSNGIVRVWNVKNGYWIFQSEKASGAALSEDGLYVLTSPDFCLWHVETRQLVNHFDIPHESGYSICENEAFALSPNCRCLLVQDYRGTLLLLKKMSEKKIISLTGHTSRVDSLAWSSDERRILSGSCDKTLRLWDAVKGKCLCVFEGHTDIINGVAWSANQHHVISCSSDKTVRLWDAEKGNCLRILEGHTAEVISVAYSADGRSAFSGDSKGGIRVWDLSEFVTETRSVETLVPDLSFVPEQVQYTNAKVLLVGESGVGKTGLSMRLVKNCWQPSDSTVGAWATQWKLPVASNSGVEQEIWLWDFGGQADQRLIHQLYMEDTSLAVLVFNGQKEDLFETLGQWDRDITRASCKPFTKLLAVGRVDTGGLRAASRGQIEAFAKERMFVAFLETSAKTGEGCEELKQAILRSIQWENIPWRSSPLLFKRLKEEIIRLKDEGRVLMRFNELRDALRLRLYGKDVQFKDEELKAVVGLLAGPGVVWELAFGSWVLLQPERINAYAQAVIQTLRSDEYERGCIPEERVLNGELMYQSSMKCLEADDERFVLLAMHQTLVDRGLCLREHTDKGPLLIFPSYYRRERPEPVEHPAVLVSYRFNGFLDDIYATLVVRLHHMESFERDELWRYAADFKTLTGKQLGVKLTRRAEGAGELEVYFAPSIPVEEKIIFSRYVHEHLLQKGQDVVRLRHYVCPHCGTPVGNREVAMKRLETWLNNTTADIATGMQKVMRGKTVMPTILCSQCEKRVPLWDKLEQWFASPEVQQRVRKLQDQSAILLDNESKERALVGEVISTVALAGQISREFNVSDHGIDMEIEFKDDAGEATGQKLYLQLKSGDSYLRERKSDGAEIFIIKEERHARYWMAQKFPVFLIIRNSKGEIRWMEVRDWLKRASNDGKKPVTQIVFKGERFDVMGVRCWRELALGQRLP